MGEKKVKKLLGANTTFLESKLRQPVNNSYSVLRKKSVDSFAKRLAAEEEKLRKRSLVDKKEIIRKMNDLINRRGRYHDMEVEVTQVNSNGTVNLTVYGSITYGIMYVAVEDIDFYN